METMDTTGTSVHNKSRLSPHTLACTPTMFLCKSLVLPERSLIGTSAQSKQVSHCENPLTDTAPLRVFFHCC